MKAIIFDTETSGLVENRTRSFDRQPEIIEFYGCFADLTTGKIKSDLNLLIKPKKELTEDNIKRHGITNEMLKKAPPFENIAAGIMKFFNQSKIIIAHNATFDKDMIELEFERMGKVIKLPRMICTVEQTIHIKGHRLSLSDLHDYLFGEKFEGAHRAKVDVAALLKCCVELHKKGMI